jgi:hypothetical protein
MSGILIGDSLFCNMKFFRFYDYMYYSFCRYYYKNKDDSARFTGLGTLCIIQTITLFEISALFKLDKKLDFNETVVGLITYFLLIIINGIRYNRLNYDVLSERWNDEGEGTKEQKVISIRAYIVITIIVFIILVFINTKFSLHSFRGT